ncbi:MAG: YcjF family protein, partial [Dolichospermum sp.]
QKISWEKGQEIAKTMGSLMLKLGLVELSTKAVTGILKTNVATFVAGGMVEGVSAAYLTRVAGLSLIEYFQEQEIALESGNALNLEKLRQVLPTVFQQNQKMAILEAFVKQGVKRLLPEVKPAEVVA